MKLCLQFYVVFGPICAVIQVKGPGLDPDNFVGGTDLMRGTAARLLYSVFDFPLPNQLSTIAPR
jgi:hypothetical protein